MKFDGASVPGRYRTVPYFIKTNLDKEFTKFGKERLGQH